MSLRSSMYLEFDDERSGGFTPLRYIPKDKHVVLGLITTKSPFLENEEKVIQRLTQASEYVDPDRLSLSPQCGFASCEIGNKLSEAQQWKKLELVNLPRLKPRASLTSASKEAEEK